MPASAAQPLITERAPWGLVLMLGSLTALGPLAIDMYLPALPAITRSLHVASGEGTITLAAFFIGLSVGQLVYGPASDRLGRRGPMILGVALFVLGAVLCAMAPNIWVLVIARFLQAMGGSAGQVIARAAVRDRFGHQMAARVLSLLMLVLGIAPIVAPLFGGYLLLVGDWRAIFWFQAATASAILVAVLLWLRESRSEEHRAAARAENPIKSFGYLLGHPRVMGFALSGGFNTGSMFAWIAMSSNLLIEIYHITPSNFGWWFGANAAGFIAMSQVNAHLMRWRTPEEVLIWARPISIFFAVIVLVDAVTGLGGMLGVILPLYATQATFGLVGPNTQAAAMNVDPARAGSISSITGSMGFAIGAAISTIAVYLRDGTPRPLAVIVLVMIVASAAALYGLAKPVSRRAQVAV